MSRQDTVRALRFRLSPHRAALALTAGRLKPQLRHGAPGSPLRLTEIPRPVRPPGWVRIAPSLSGICGSDRKMLDITGMELTLTALYGLPTDVVPGHEIVGTVIEADPAAHVSPGDRVVAEPLLDCRDKGYEPCPRCRAGAGHLCAHFADRGGPADAGGGPGFGFDTRFGGGWAEELVAPAGHVHPVPATLDDRTAVLAEPTAIGVHAVLTNLPDRDARVLVIGPGAIGLLLVAALRVLRPDVHVTVAGIGHAADDHARRIGAHALVHGTTRRLVTDAADTLGASLRGTRLSGPVLEDGFDAVFDTVGSTQTIDDALRMTRPRGTVVMVATSGRRSVDWSLVWARELRIHGTVYYGLDEVPDDAGIAGTGARHAMAVALDVLAEARPGHLLTHVFPLDEPVAALGTAAAGPAAEAVKVAFAPTG